jgi:hypothetical protein
MVGQVCKQCHMLAVSFCRYISTCILYFALLCQWRLNITKHAVYPSYIWGRSRVILMIAWLWGFIFCLYVYCICLLWMFVWLNMCVSMRDKRHSMVASEDSQLLPPQSELFYDECTVIEHWRNRLSLEALFCHSYVFLLRAMLFSICLCVWSVVWRYTWIPLQ